jgi:thioredoxin reductase/ferredoxin
MLHCSIVFNGVVMSFDPAIWAYAVPAFPIWAIYSANRYRRAQRVISVRDEAREAGLTEPPSLHPAIDPDLCIGCSACIRACPEGEIIGLVDGKATLIDPTACIGHGACQAACPAAAISLVFGTATRGIDIPFVDAAFQTSVPGIYIAGELGGMGLIRNAIEQGRQAVASICAAADATDEGEREEAVLDLFIVGAGPAGISASLAATEAGISFRTVEQDTLGGTVAHFPRNKLVMTQPAILPIYGELKFREIRKEALLEIWSAVIAETGLEIGYGERVIAVTPTASGFDITTSIKTYSTRHVLLAIGRRGTPRTLDVPGEDSSKVTYRLTDPAQYAGMAVVVVGGGDSAIEAALALAEQPDTQVTLCYRSDAFTRARKPNRDSILQAHARGDIDLALSSHILMIEDKTITIRKRDATVAIANDAVIVCAGGILPTPFLKTMGIEVERKFGTG